MKDEIIENQRWYMIYGWSSTSGTDDPPAWSNSSREIAKIKEDYPNLTWEVYKAKDYDEDGWLYSTSFQDEFGRKTLRSTVRSRVWMGSCKVNEGTAENPIVISDKEVAPDLAVSEAKDLISLAKKKEVQDKNSADVTCDGPRQNSGNDSQQECMKTGVPDLIELAKITDSLEVHDVKSTESKETKSTSRFFSLSAIASGTISTVREVSAYAYDSAHVAARGVISSDSNYDHRKARDSHSDRDPYTILSTLSKKMINLSEFERSLVVVCLNENKADIQFLHPPDANTSSFCQTCEISFGVTKFRYYCSYCMNSFCREDLPFALSIQSYGKILPEKVCRNCDIILRSKVEADHQEWRVERTKDYLAEQLQPYYSVDKDTVADKAIRAAGGTLTAAKSAPFGITAKMAIQSADFIRKYGRTGLIGFLLRNEFMESYTTLKSLLGNMESISFQDAAIGLYYFMASNRGERGSFPGREKELHSQQKPIPNDLLREFLRYAPIALHAIYQLNVLDIQRLSRLQNMTLIYASIDDCDINRPAFALFGDRKNKVALVAIRGSKSAHDLLTDLRVVPHSSEINNSEPHIEGLDNEGSQAFDNFAHDGMLKAVMWIKEKVVGSLNLLTNSDNGYKVVITGHSLGGGCGALLAVMLKPQFPSVQCYGYGVPSCADLNIATDCREFVHSCILRDDFVPRIKPENIVTIAEELKNFKNEWQNHATEDWGAIRDRLKQMWVPRKREWAKTIYFGDNTNTKNDNKTECDLSLPSPSAQSDDVHEKDLKRQKSAETTSDWSVTPDNLLSKYNEVSSSKIEIVQERQGRSTKVETKKHQELFVPGSIIHIYFHQGCFEAVYVDHSFPSLNHIPVFNNMLTDHLGKNYLDSLRNVRDSRKAIRKPNNWVPFNTKTRCMCCDSPFTWNSTSSSEAQQNRDQHNCRKCGALVCHGCSEKRKALPDYGINIPVRVCDRCFYQVESPTSAQSSF